MIHAWGDPQEIYRKGAAERVAKADTQTSLIYGSSFRYW
jgi:hypothetical protein